MRYALKFAYDGTRFEGYARQPGKTTVEGEVIKAMTGLGMITSAPTAGFRSASRTDRGVSAAGNVIAVDTEFPYAGIADAINSKLEGIVFWGIARVPDDFNPRHARLRHYRYFLPAEDAPSVEKLRKAAKHFTGTHDFRQFSKKDTGKENTVLAIDSIDISEQDGTVIFDIKAQRFLWELVRRMLSAIVSVAEGKVKAGTMKKMLAGEPAMKGGIKPLEPEFLVLVDVEYYFDFEFCGIGHDYFRKGAAGLRARAQVMGAVNREIGA
jgi:tRNA pseudouridine38-40 synthase